mgnify:CR=1 FL=1
MNMLDTSGFSCPEPVIMTKKALKDRPASLDVIVDNVASRENVTRYAEAVGYNVKRTDKDGKWILSLTR